MKQCIVNRRGRRCDPARPLISDRQTDRQTDNQIFKSIEQQRDVARTIYDRYSGYDLDLVPFQLLSWGFIGASLRSRSFFLLS